MATTTKYKFDLLYHMEKMSERALMVVACKPKKKIFLKEHNNYRTLQYITAHYSALRYIKVHLITLHYST